MRSETDFFGGDQGKTSQLMLIIQEISSKDSNQGMYVCSVWALGNGILNI